MGVIPWGFESPLRHQVEWTGNGAPHFVGEAGVVSVGGSAPFPVHPALRALLPECGESRTETPEQERMGSGNATPSRSWLGNRNSLARRRRRAAASSDWSLLIVKVGNPLSHFPPKLPAANQRFAAIYSFRAWHDVVLFSRMARDSGAPVSDWHRPPTGGRNREQPPTLTGRREGNAGQGTPVFTPAQRRTAARRAADGPSLQWRDGSRCPRIAGSEPNVRCHLFFRAWHDIVLFSRMARDSGAPVSDWHRPPTGGRNREQPPTLTGRRSVNAHDRVRLHTPPVMKKVRPTTLG